MNVLFLLPILIVALFGGARMKAPDLNQDQLTLLEKSLRIEVAKEAASRGDVLAWGKAIFPTKFELPFCHELHDYFVDIRGEERTSTEAPRGHAKTTVKCFLIPIYQALEEPKTFRHYLNVQETGKKAAAVNSAIRLELEENEVLQAIYGDQVTQEKWTEESFVLANGVIFSAIGAGQSIRGINYRNIRPDYIIIDDLYGEDDVDSITATMKKNDWFWGSLYKARAIGRRTSVQFQGTAINSEDQLEKLKSNPQWKDRTFKQVDFAAKTVIWSEVQSYEDAIAEMENSPITIWMRESQNERKDDSQSIVKRSWLENWEYDPDELVFTDDLEYKTTELGGDPSVGKEGVKKNKNDPTGIAVINIAQFTDSKAPRYYITQLVNEKLSLNDRITTLNRINENQSDDFRIRAARLEGQGGFGDFVAEAKRRTTLPIKEVTQSKDKLANLELRSHHFQNGNVFISTHIPQKLRDELKHQLCTNFPKHDDLRDAVLLVLEKAAKRASTWRPIA